MKHIISCLLILNCLFSVQLASPAPPRIHDILVLLPQTVTTAINRLNGTLDILKIYPEITQFFMRKEALCSLILQRRLETYPNDHGCGLGNLSNSLHYLSNYEELLEKLGADSTLARAGEDAIEQCILNSLPHYSTICARQKCALLLRYKLWAALHNSKIIAQPVLCLSWYFLRYPKKLAKAVDQYLKTESLVKLQQLFSDAVVATSKYVANTAVKFLQVRREQEKKMCIQKFCTPFAIVCLSDFIPSSPIFTIPQLVHASGYSYTATSNVIEHFKQFGIIRSIGVRERSKNYIYKIYEDLLLNDLKFCACCEKEIKLMIIEFLVKYCVQRLILSRAKRPLEYANL